MTINYLIIALIQCVSLDVNGKLSFQSTFPPNAFFSHKWIVQLLENLPTGVNPMVI